jgi:hypothetical protein
VVEMDQYIVVGIAVQDIVVGTRIVVVAQDIVVE